ncbi:MAG: hypothetical protein RSC06_15600 [Clostridia bacterium]
MLEIMTPEIEYYDEGADQFVRIPRQSLQLEHSLISVSRWESKWKKPFLGKDFKTQEEVVDYIRCMTKTQHVGPLVYYAITPEQHDAIAAYLEDSATATTFSEKQNKRFNSEIITSEIIYYWMISLQIPFECEKWNLNRLLTLIRVCNIKNAPQKKMSPKDIYCDNRALNAARRASMRTKG